MMRYRTAPQPRAPGTRRPDQGFYSSRPETYIYPWRMLVSFNFTGPKALHPAGKLHLPGDIRADDRVRTGDPDLGKVVLYQLSYVRVVGRPACRQTGLPGRPLFTHAPRSHARCPARNPRTDNDAGGQVRTLRSALR